MVIYRRLPPKPRHYVCVRRRWEHLVRTRCTPSTRTWTRGTAANHLHGTLGLAPEFHTFAGSLFLNLEYGDHTIW